MAVDPNNPSLPIPSSQVEVSAELRGIKGVLKSTRDAGEVNTTKLAGFTAFSPLGLLLAQNLTSDEDLNALGFTPTGKSLTQTESYAALAVTLGVVNPVPGLVSNANGICMTLAGGIKFQMVTRPVGGSGDTYNWPVPFTSQVFYYGAVLQSTAGNAAYMKNVTLTSYFADHENLSTQTLGILGIGI